MTNTITANTIKTKGVSAFKKGIKHGSAIITVRGEKKYIVLTLKEYNRLRECELLAALAETHKDLEEGNYRIETAEEHIKRIKNG